MLPRRRRANQMQFQNFSTSSSDSDKVTGILIPPCHRKPSKWPLFMVICIAVFGGLLHFIHVASLHENHLTFGLLSNQERELTFASEMSFYYAFYKQLINAETLWQGILDLFNDTQTEFPSQLGCLNWSVQLGYLPDIAFCSANRASQASSLSALERFNIYPEIILASLYRIIKSWNLISSDCYTVSVDYTQQNYAFAVPPETFSLINQESFSLLPFKVDVSDPLISCDGLAEAPNFYVNFVFCLSALTAVGLALSGWLVATAGSLNPSLSHSLVSVWGSTLPVTAFFFNHGEATRVQWTPPLRESFAYPLFILQQTVSIWILKDAFCKHRKKTRCKQLLYTLILLSVQLFWQLSPFILLTQLVSLMATYLIAIATRFPDGVNGGQALFITLSTTMQELIGCQLFSLCLSYLLQFGNRLIISSIYLPALIGCFAAYAFSRHFLTKSIHIKSSSRRHVRIGGCFHICGMVFVGLFVAIYAIILVRILFYLEDNDGKHIIDLLKVKFLGAAYQTFHTQLYTCAAEFDFLPMSTLQNLFVTGLLPAVIIAVLIIINRIVNQWMTKPIGSRAYDKSAQSTPDTSSKSLLQMSRIKNTHQLLNDVVCIYIVLQLLAFAVLAGLVMRMKLFLVPQMCLVLSILAQPQLFFGSHKLISLLSRLKFKSVSLFSGSKTSYFKHLLIHSVFIAFIAISAKEGLSNINIERSKHGQFEWISMETLLQWASRLNVQETNQPWVFSGAMPTMAILRLGLIASNAPTNSSINKNFAVTNHPHYENYLLRSRTELAYSICSRKPIESIWKIYRKILKTDFIVVERSWCINPWVKPQCSSGELWDLLDPQFASQPSLCSLFFSNLAKDDHWNETVFGTFFNLVFSTSDQSVIVLFVARET